jgi:hypothetical protein
MAASLASICQYSGVQSLVPESTRILDSDSDLVTSTSSDAVDRTTYAADRVRYFQACVVGVVGATAAFLVALLDGHPSLLQRTWRGNWYDLQAHSLLHWRWDVAPGALSNEGFIVHGKTYMYFGVWPALLRMPVAAVTQSLDGRLSQLSMLLAFFLALMAVARLAWQVRAVTTDGRPLERTELIVIAAFVAMAGVGTPILFLATRPMVYDEAALWGLAWALLTFSAVIDFSVTRRRSQLVLAAACASGAIMSRATLGVSAILAIGFLGLAAAVPQRRRAAFGLDALELTLKDAVGLGAACVVAVVPYMYVNYARFGSLTSVPYMKQPILTETPGRLHALRANGGSLFGLKYIPTTIVQYFRPDAIHWSWPLPTFGTKLKPLFGVIIGGASPTAGVVDSMLAFMLLAIIGVVWLWRRSDRGPDKHIVVIPLAAGVVGAFATLSFSYLGDRYLADFVPLVVLISLIGLNATIHWLRSAKPTTRRIASAGLVAVVALNLWASFGLARTGEQLRRVHQQCDVSTSRCT